MRTRHVVLLVLGCLLALPSLGLLGAGIALLGVNAVGRDDAGWFTSPSVVLQSRTVAVTVEDVPTTTVGPAAEWAPELLDVDLRLRVRPADTGEPVLLAVGPADDVAAYLAGTAHDRVDDVVDRVARLTRVPGDDDIAPPTEQTFWTSQDVGTDDLELHWKAAPQDGPWTVVLMNADGSTGVAASAIVQARTDVLVPVAWGLLAAGVVGALLTVALLASAVASTPTSGPGGPPAGAVVGPGPVGTGTGVLAPPGSVAGTPVVLTARLDPGLSRWMWLVKWLLALPHLVLLAFLWAALVLTTLISGVAILVTGRYPRSLFDFGVGVLRWSWRVSYYCSTGGLGTDRYPPFTLAAQPDDDAALDVAYPARLSRGLWLVKWLLALPHLLVLALIEGSQWSWTPPDGSGVRYELYLPGLLGVLVLVAAVVLLFAGAYPATLFDLVVGLNRWVYRVSAYLLLMTDEYPPFRLDTGGTEHARSGPSGPGG